MGRNEPRRGWVEKAESSLRSKYFGLQPLSFSSATEVFTTQRTKMSSSHATLGAAADERKARLAQLKSLKRKQPTEESADEPARDPTPPASPDIAKLHLSGRNYDPEAKGPKLGFEAPPTLAVEKTLEQQAKEVEDEVRRKEAEEAADDGEKGVDLFKLQPKKPNWDLKRDLEKKLEVLGVRTENAIARMVRARVEGAQKSAKGKGDSEVGMEGVALVEALKAREREEDEEERREKEDEELQ